MERIIAIVSDIHTNRAAWKAVKADLLAQKVDDIWSLGDWFGYSNQDPLGFWDEIRRKDAKNPNVLDSLIHHPEEHAVLGNHDLAVLVDDQDYEALIAQFNDRAKSTIERQRKQLRSSKSWKDIQDWLKRTRYVLSPERGVYVTHAGFNFQNVDLIPLQNTKTNADRQTNFTQLTNWLTTTNNVQNEKIFSYDGWDAPRLLVTGHTHKPGAWYRDANSYRWMELEGASIPKEEIEACKQEYKNIAWKVQFNFSKDNPIWLNPGSVGKPRDIPKEAWKDHYWAQYITVGYEKYSGSATYRWIAYQGKE